MQTMEDFGDTSSLLQPSSSDICDESSQQYFNKLTSLLPNSLTAPILSQTLSGQLSRLQVIECVIDYIAALEDTLDSRHQTSATRDATRMTASNSV